MLATKVFNASCCVGGGVGASRGGSLGRGYLKNELVMEGYRGRKVVLKVLGGGSGRFLESLTSVILNNTV